VHILVLIRYRYLFSSALACCLEGIRSVNRDESGMFGSCISRQVDAAMCVAVVMDARASRDQIINNEFLAYRLSDVDITAAMSSDANIY